MKRYWQSIVLGFSLANICLYGQWANLELHTSSLLYRYENASPFPMTYVAMVLNLLILGSLLSVFIHFMLQRKQRFVMQSIFFAVFFLGLNSLRSVLRSILQWRELSAYYVYEQLGSVGSIVVASVLFVFGLYLFLKKNDVVMKASQVLLTLAFPLAIFHLGWAVVNLSTDNYGSAQLAASRTNQLQSSNQRVVWVIFDTMEYRTAFSDRLEGLELPEFDALKKQSFFGTQVFSPGARTHYSLASYLTGNVVRLGYAANGNDSKLFFKKDAQEYLFSALPNFFSKARDLGFSSGLLGWYHPYCRMLAEDLERCVYHSVNEVLQDHPVPELLPSMAIHARKIFPRRTEAPAVEAARYFYEKAPELAADPKLDVVFLHMTVPHPPWVYDRKGGKIADVDADPRNVEGFKNNLALADKSLGAIRAKMEANGLWEKSTVLVSSDHWWWFGTPKNQVYQPQGTLDFRIPFLLKMAGSQSAQDYHRPFNAVLAHDLLLEVLGGKLKNNQDVSKWLNEQAPRFEVTPVLETNIFG